MKVLILTLLFVATFAKHETYVGWKSFYIEPSTTKQLQALHGVTGTYELDFLSHPTAGREGVTLVKPQYIETFTKYLDEQAIPYRIHADDIKKQLDYDDYLIEAKNNASIRNGGRLMPYDNYQRLNVIYEYMDYIAARYPQTVTMVTPAKSFHGRPIKYLKISTTNFEDTRKPVIFIDGGIHAREWISPPSVTWAIHKLVEDITEPDLLQNFDWIILPVVNPDGYDFTFTNTRFWRKTRSTDQSPIGSLCPGVDGNRNYDFFFGTVGTSSNPCAETFPGSRAFSEVETRVVRDILFEYLDRIALYLTIHSYGSMILYPWGHDGSLSSNALMLHTVGVAMAQAIDALSLPNFPNYVVGNAVPVLGYGASGASEDYAHLIGVPLSYTYELPGLGWGTAGFHLDPIYINQVVQETWAGYAAGARRAGELFVDVIKHDTNKYKI